MLQNHVGKIVNVTPAPSAFLGDAPYRPVSKYRHFTAYTSSKSGLTEYVSYQLASKNIQVNAMQPAGQTRGLQEIRDRMEELGETEFVQRVDSIGGRAAQIRDSSSEMTVFLASADSGNLSGRLLWYGEDFHNLPIQDIMASETYTMRRMELDS